MSTGFRSVYHITTGLSFNQLIVLAVYLSRVVGVGLTTWMSRTTAITRV